MVSRTRHCLLLLVLGPAVAMPGVARAQSADFQRRWGGGDRSTVAESHSCEIGR